jgi:preprotein translocase subunit SecE
VNRQTKRMMQRQGSDRPRSADERREERRNRTQAQTTGPKREKIGPLQYVAEARSELRKVNWPNRREVTNSTIVVLICVVFMTTLIFGFDYLSSKFVLFLFG